MLLAASPVAPVMSYILWLLFVTLGLIVDCVLFVIIDKVIDYVAMHRHHNHRDCNCKVVVDRLNHLNRKG